MNGAAGPMFVGGVGGSGTRVVASLLRDFGWRLDGDLNDAFDNLWFTLLFKRADILHASPSDWSSLIDLFVRAMSDGGARDSDAPLVERIGREDRPQHPAAWLRERASSLLAALAEGPKAGRWSCKEPNTHVVLDRLLESLPTMRYILVMRHGLDMAWSRNTNQAMLWGAAFVGAPWDGTPSYMLRYWCAAHRRALRLGASMPGRFLVVRYDDLCRDPRSGIAEICRFAECDETTVAPDCWQRVVPAASMGRWRDHGVRGFDQADVDYVAECGFSVSDG